MSKTLVAYFSAESGSTKALAETLAMVTGADKFEIGPAKPYSKADLNYSNPLARCNREQIAKKDVPIAGTVVNMADYDTVLIGFPIWYYNAPMIIKTFVQQYDLAGKKIGLFATSGGSDIGKTAEKLMPYLKNGATVSGAQVFARSASEEVLKAWVDTL